MELTTATIFGNIVITLSEPDLDGQRSGLLVQGLERPDPDIPDVELDVLEQLILAHGCAGVDIESEAYCNGINTVLEAIDNNS